MIKRYLVGLIIGGTALRLKIVILFEGEGLLAQNGTKGQIQLVNHEKKLM